MVRAFLMGLMLGLLTQPVSALCLQGTLFEKIGIEVGVDPLLLYSVALAESAYDNNNDSTIAPYPWTLRTTVPIYLNSHEEAKARLRFEMKNHRSIDVGLMQINLRWHAHRVSDPMQLLDPEINLRIGAQILRQVLHSSAHDLVMGIGHYHSYDAEKALRYGSTVYRIYLLLLKESDSCSRPPV